MSIRYLPLIALLLLFAACGGDDADVDGPLTADDVMTNLDAYGNETIAVAGRIDQVWGPRVFSLVASGAQPFLVVSVDSLPVVPGRSAQAPFATGDSVLVSGQFQEYDDASIRQQYRVRLDSALMRYQGAPTLVARSAASILESVTVTPAPTVRDTMNAEM